MESFSPRFKAKAVCAVCGRTLDRFPLFHCPQKHPCCQECYKELRFVSTGNNDSQLSCPLCRLMSPCADSRSVPTGPNQIQGGSRPGIGRPYRYNVNTLPITSYNYSQNYQDFSMPSSSATDDEEKMFETFIGMTKEKFYKSQRNTNRQNNVSKVHSPRSKFSLPPSSMSKKPFRCPHKPCHKTVALAQFVSHFKSEHKDVQVCAVERGKELLLPCDVSSIEYNFHYCLAMITVYEINRIDYLRSGSNQSIVKTCNKFCQKVPISTFWLLVTGVPERKWSSAYCLFWLFTNSEDSYKCTIELGSKEDSTSLSTYCEIANALDKDFANVTRKLQCLIVTRSSLKSILKEGAALNLRVTVH